MKGVETVDAGMVWWVVMRCVGGGGGHAHKALQVAVVVGIWTHAGGGHGVRSKDTRSS